MKKAGKIFLYAMPVMLAGGLYLGESTGMNEVLAKTVTTMVQIETLGTKCGVTVLDENKGKEYDDGGYRYVYTGSLAMTVGADLHYYDKYNVIKTGIETETEVPDAPQTKITSDKMVPTITPTEQATEDKVVIAPTEETTAEVTENTGTEAANDKVTPALDPEEEETGARARLEEAERNREKAREEAAWKVQKEKEKRTEDFIKVIEKSIREARRKAAQVQTQPETISVSTEAAEAAEAPAAVIKTEYFTCFTQRMMKLLADNADIRYEIHYRYKGKQYVLIIPAGADYSQLQDSNGYFGFRYLDSIFGGYEESTK